MTVERASGSRAKNDYSGDGAAREHHAGGGAAAGAGRYIAAAATTMPRVLPSDIQRADRRISYFRGRNGENTRTRINEKKKIREKKTQIRSRTLRFFCFFLLSNLFRNLRLTVSCSAHPRAGKTFNRRPAFRTVPCGRMAVTRGRDYTATDVVHDTSADLRWYRAQKTTTTTTAAGKLLRYYDRVRCTRAVRTWRKCVCVCACECMCVCVCVCC